jgi:hypothetical protein
MVPKVPHPSGALVLLSLLGCLAVAGLWARGYWRFDVVGGRFGTTSLMVGSYRGHLLWATGTADVAEGRAEWYGYESRTGLDAARPLEYLRENAAWNVAGFSYTGTVDKNFPISVLITPSWSLALLLGVLPCRRLLRSRRRRVRLRENLCPGCGYDLRGNASGVCPECGNATPCPRRD